MITINDKPSINAEQARYILERETSRLGVCIDLDRTLAYQADLIEAMKPILKPFREIAGISSLMPTERTAIMNVLKKRLNVPSYKFMAKEKEAFTMSTVSSLLDDPTISEDVKEFLKMYRILKACSYNISYLDQYIDLPLLNEESFEGNRMVLARPEWTILNTKRLSAKKPSIQNLAKHFSDIITHPKGYIMTRADSGQIEPRITYSHYIPDPLLKQLIIAYNDAYWGMVHFALMSEEEERIARSNLSKVSKKELPSSLRSDLKLILLVGNYGGDITNRGFDPMLVSGFRDKIQRHPLRLEWEAQVNREVDEGAETFYTAFGTPITPEETVKYKRGSMAWVGHVKRCGINNPIQGTASDLMCESVYQAYRILQEKSSGNSYIGYYKHDEGLFYLSEKDYHLKDDLTGCLAYQVRDWIPIYSDVLEGVKPAIPIKNLEDLTADIIED